LPVGQVDRVRISFVNSDNPEWVVDPSSFSVSDLTIKFNGTSVDLSNGLSGQFKVGIVKSDVSMNTFWVIGLPRVSLAPGDYSVEVTGSIDFLDAPGGSSQGAVTPTGSQAWTQRSGSAAAWGGNTSGQTTVPAGLTNVVSVAAGGNFSLALKGDGTVTAWGSGTGSTSLPASLTNTATANVVQIAAGNNHALALKQDGTIVSWGTDGAYGVVTNTPASGNFYSIAAGMNSSLAIGENGGSAAETVGSSGTLTTWGQYTSFGESLYVIPDVTQGMIQASAGNDFLVGVQADGSFFGMGELPSSPIDTSGSYVQAAAGVNPTSTSQKFVLLLSNDFSSASGTVQGWGDNTYGQINPTSVGSKAPTTLTVPISNTSRIDTGSSHSIALNSNDNAVKSWGYNGVPADNRVTGAEPTYTAATATVGGISAGTLQSLAQVMDLTAPTIASTDLVPQPPLSTNAFPLVYRVTFSEPINLDTMTTANFLATDSGGTSLGSGFPITAVSLVSGTTSTYEVTIGTVSTSPPANFNASVYLTLVNPNATSGAFIRDEAGNALASGNTTSSTGIAVASTGLSTTNGTDFDGKRWVKPGVITFTLSFSQDVSVAEATNISNYAFSVTSGTLPAPSIISIVASPNPSASVSKIFTIQVVTGNPSPTDSAADLQLYLKANTVQIPSGSGTYNTQIDSNTVRVDNITPVISSVTASDATGATPSSTNVTGTTGATVYFKVVFNDAVQFAGAAGSVASYFSFTTGTFADSSRTLVAYVASVFNTASADYSDTWIVQVAAVGQGTLGMTVKPNYTSGGTTYSITSPVGESPASQVSSSNTAWTIANNVYTTAATVNGPNGLNPSNTIISPNGLTYNQAQRSQVKLLQYQFFTPVANLGTALTGSDFKLQQWVGDNATGSFQDVSTIGVTIDSASGGTGAFNSTYNLSFYATSAPSTPLWTLPNGYYQVVPTTPANIKDQNGIVYTSGPATYADDFEFYRMFGNGNGDTGGIFFPISVDQDDYLTNTAAFVSSDQSSAWNHWSFYSLTGPTGSPFGDYITQDDNLGVLQGFTTGLYLDGRVITQLNP
jgi:hypothetical protein